ncbi:hypothetical protein [Nocardioides sp.]|uniref:hypothetical protein n=1 Tax=Nocardioides sp. TaxID=35761 RepID=UPI003D11F59B
MNADAHLLGQAVAANGTTVSVWNRYVQSSGTTYIRAAVRRPNQDHWGPMRTLDSWKGSGGGSGSVVPAGTGVLAGWVTAKGRIALMRWDSTTGWGRKTLVPGAAKNSVHPQLLVNPAAGLRAVAYYRLVSPRSWHSVLRVAVQRHGVWTNKTVGRSGDISTFEDTPEIVSDDAGNVTVAWRFYSTDDYGDVTGYASRLGADAATWEAPHSFGFEGEIYYTSHPTLLLEPDDSVTLFKSPPFYPAPEDGVQVWNRAADGPWTLTENVPGTSYLMSDDAHVERNSRGDLLAVYPGHTLVAKPAGGTWQVVALGSDFELADAVLADDGRIAAFGIGPNASALQQVQVRFGTIAGLLGDPTSLTTGQAKRMIADATLAPNGSISLDFARRVQSPPRSRAEMHNGLVLNIDD